MATMMTKEHLINLLSDEEIARIARAEDDTRLGDGEEYVDLDHVEKGIQRVGKAAKVPTHTLVPKRAVSEKTWREIQNAFAH